VTIPVTEFLGDGIGPELAASVHAVAAALPVPVEFRPIDLTLENRQKRGEPLFDEAVRSFEQTRLAFKYPTVTKGVSPNAVLRRRCDFSVIHRPVISIPGIDSNFKENLELHIVRVATGGTYEHGGELVSPDVAVSLRVVDRKPCREAAAFGFELARKLKKSVTSSSKHTIQRTTDGLFEQVVAEISRQYPEVPHRVELFDSLLAKLILKPHDYHVVVCLNEYGDFLSDMACGLVGSLGTGASGNYSFDGGLKVRLAMFDPAGGTAPDIAGKNKANPTAALLAFGMLLNHVDRYDLGHALRLALRGLIKEGERTPDLGGNLSTTEYTDRVIKRVRQELG
jgi:isocitrate dehydrogenase (NAD+)